MEWNLILPDTYEPKIRNGTADPGSRDPLISIIIVVFQDRAELQSVLESVLSKRSRDVEIIVIDGGSDDGTLELLRGCDSQIDHWISESDEGIYDAMNKGIAFANGQYILHLNAGDRLEALPIEQLRQCAAEQTDVACFRVLEDGGSVYKPRTGFLMKIDNGWHHQGTFYRRSQHLGYDITYRVFGDFELNQRMLRAGRSIRIYDQIVARHQNNGLSAGPAHRSEIYRSIRKNFGSLYLPVAFVRFKLNEIRVWWKGHILEGRSRNL